MLSCPPGIQLVEFGAHGVRVGVVKRGEDGQSLLPRVAGSLAIAGVMVAVAEVGERLRLQVLLTEFSYMPMDRR